MTQSNLALACLSLQWRYFFAFLGLVFLSTTYGQLSNTKIAFASNRDGNYEIYVMNADGTGLLRLTNNPAGDFDPSWSPDGSKILFVSERDGNNEIYAMNSDGTYQTRLTSTSVNEDRARFSPNGSKIVFISQADIYVMDANGSNQLRLTNNSNLVHANVDPTWSADGTRIAFVSNRSGKTEIWIMNADGSNQLQLTNSAGPGFLAWSPNGNKIAFHSSRDGNAEIYVINSDGTSQTRLTNNTATDGIPAWSPDGTKIVFYSTRDGNAELYVMNSDGTNQSRLTNSAGTDFYPSWSPFLPVQGEYSTDPNTVLLLHMNETSGSTVSDASTYGNNGTATGTTIVDGRFGKAKRFNNAANSTAVDYINCGNSPSLNPSSAITIEAWIYLTTSSNGYNGNNTIPIISKDDSWGGSQPAYTTSVDGSSPNNIPNGSFGFSIYAPGTSSLQLNRWYHLAFVAFNNGGTATGKVYVNGSLDGSQTVSGNLATNSLNTWIGRRYGVSGGAPYNAGFAGLIDEVRISNIARSPSEFNLQLPPKSLTALASGTAITLNWQNGGGAVGLLRYKIYRGTDSTATLLIDSTTSTLYTNFGLTAGTRYFYRVSAVDSTGFEGAKSYAASATISSVPTIVSFSPTSGPIGTSVTITGTNFSTTPANNIVYFGAVKATVISATPTSLVVTVPAGATYQPITVTVNGLTAYSLSPFIVTFSGGGSITASSFASKVDFTTGTGPNGASIGDIDGDGKVDIVTANEASNSISIFKNASASGSITQTSFANKVDLAAGSSPHRIAVGDLDGDGKPDIAVANWGAGTVSVYRNISTSGSITTGSFTAKTDFLAGNSPNAVTIVDVDGDGKPDLVVANNLSNTISVLRNSSTIGNISFDAKVDFSTGSGPVMAATADLDGDGKTDLVVTNQRSNTVSIFRNTSSPGSVSAASFALKIDYPTGTTPFGPTVGDLDGDGKIDLVIPGYNDNTVSILHNTTTSGSLSFASKVDIAAGTNPSHAAIGDLDGDGKPDLAVSNYGSGTVSVMRNLRVSGTLSSVSFSSKIDFGIGSNSYTVDLCDLDGDGKPDIVVSNYGSNSVSVLRNTVGSLARSLYVSTSGNDANAGTAVAPLRNIQTALTRASSGDTVKVASGSYNEGIITSSQAILLGGYDNTFAESKRDIFANRTTLVGVSTTMVYDRYGSAFDGLFLDGNAVAQTGLDISTGSKVTHTVLINISAGFGYGIMVNGNATVTNSTLRSITRALTIQSGAAGTSVKNNIFSNNSFALTNSAANGIAKYNGYFGNSFNYTGSFTTPGIGDLALNPQFRSTSTNDYRLASNSPCIDAGDPTDPVGNEPAPNNTRIDMGAYGGTKNAGGPDASIPTVTTNTASSVTSTSATLNGSVNPNGLTTTAYFEWGTSSTLATSTATTYRSIGSGLSAVSVTANLTGLSASTTYYYRAVGQNSAGTERGSIVSFRTSSDTGCIPVSIASQPQDKTVASGSTATFSVAVNGTAPFLYFWYKNDIQIPGASSSSYTTGALTAADNGSTYKCIITNCNSSNQAITNSASLTVTQPQQLPNLTPYRPSGWGDKIVVSNTTGTTTDASTIYSDENVYVDWAVINNGSVATGARFYTKLYVDNVEVGSWFTDPPVNVNFFTYVEDANIGKLSAGTHTFKIVTDATSVITESDESDNEYSGIKVVSTRPPATTTLSSPANGATNQPTTLTLSWNVATGATSYRLQVSTNQNFTTTVLDDSTITGTSRQVGPLAYNATYYWRVNAKNAGGTSPFTPASSFGTVGITTVAMPTPLSFPSSPTSSTDYRLVSIPGAGGAITVGDILSGTQKVDWRVYKDNGAASNFLVELSSGSPFSTGEGYWFLKKGTLNISRTVTLPSVGTDGMLSIPLHTGWNIIGNPFEKSVQWSAVQSANGLSASLQPLAYNGSYVSSLTIQPFSGYYFDNRTAGLSQLKIPYPFGSLKIVSPAPPRIDWKLQLVFESDINADRENYIGIAPSSAVEQDEMDIRKPPLFLDQGFLYFDRPRWDSEYCRFAGDFRPALGDGQAWDFEVRNPRMSQAKITVSGVEQIPADYDITLLNVSNSAPVNVRMTNEYSYQTVSERMRFKLIVGKKSFVQTEIQRLVPESFSLDQNYPNPFNPSTSITFRAPRSSYVRLELYSLLGQRIITLVDRSVPAGVHTVLWNAMDESGQPVASGIYIYKITAEGFAASKKMVLLR